jgi:adenylate cyclase
MSKLDWCERSMHYVSAAAMGGIDRITSGIREAVAELASPGERRLPGAELARVGRVAITLTIVATNLIGAGAVLAIAFLVVPTPPLDDPGHVELVNLIAFAVYVALAFPIGVAVGTRGMLRLRKWLMEDRPATAEEVRTILRSPARLFVVQVALWFVAAIVFGIINATFSGALAVRVVITVVITGLVTAASAYLLTELLLRPAAARALDHGAPERLVVPGVATRAVLAWLGGTGLPLAGVVAIGILGLAADSSITVKRLAVVMVALGGVGILVGLNAVTLAARATADPVDSVRRALARVQKGELDVRVPVYDGTQIGQLQLGFNAMVEGLAEREKIRDAFGAYVDPDVAEHILKEGTNLAGEEVEVTIMFLDIRDFTAFAEETPADKVVAAINDLFEQIVPIIHDCGGHVDKFVGDGLLAVFGAPRRRADHADRALKAALGIGERVNSSEGLKLGIGLNSGMVVAGNVGGAGRLEFSVIGDPVNVAARVEAATRETGDTILLTERTRDLLADSHPELAERSGIELKGKRETVKVYAPED